MAAELKTATTVRNKTTLEIIKQDLDFVNDGLATGETLSSVSASGVIGPDSVLEIDSAQASGTKVQFQLSAGTVGETYQVWARVTTSGGQTLEGAGLVYVGNL